MHAPRAPHLDVAIGDVKFRVGHFSGRVGSFILMQVTTKVIPSVMGGSIRLKGMPFALGGAPMNEEEFYALQNHCLSVCSVLNETGTAAPVMMADGRIDPRFSDDFTVVMALTIHALKFNIEPFFSEDNPARVSLESLIPEAPSSKGSPISMPTSGDQ